MEQNSQNSQEYEEEESENSQYESPRSDQEPAPQIDFDTLAPKPQTQLGEPNHPHAKDSKTSAKASSGQKTKAPVKKEFKEDRAPPVPKVKAPF